MVHPVWCLGCPEPATRPAMDWLIALLREQPDQAIPSWLIVREDLYDTAFGDGYHGHLAGACFSEEDALGVKEACDSRSEMLCSESAAMGFQHHVERHILAFQEGRVRIQTKLKPHSRTVTPEAVARHLRYRTPPLSLWSPATHSMYPPRIRERVRLLLMVGQRLATLPACRHTPQAWCDPWLSRVVPLVLATGSEEASKSSGE